jgi:hypothetical protein
MPSTKSEYIIRPPKPFWNFWVLFLVYTPILIITVLSFSFLLEYIPSGNYEEYYFPLAVVITLNIIVFLCVYLPKNKYTFIISSEKNLLEILKYGNPDKKYELDTIIGFISKQTQLFGDRQYQLLMEKNNGDTYILFDLKNLKPYSPRQWHCFSEKFAKLSGKTYRKEYWIEDSDGKLEQVPDEQRTSISKRASYVVPIIITLIGAIGYHMSIPHADSKSLNIQSMALFGLGTVLCNMAFSFSYSYLKDKKAFKKSSVSVGVLVGLIFTIIIRSAVSYLIAVAIIFSLRF